MTPLTKTQLLQTFSSEPNRERKVGIEVEFGLVSKEDALPIAFLGDVSVSEYLSLILDATSGCPIQKCGHVVGVDMGRLGSIALETGGAIEYCSPATSKTGELRNPLRTAMQLLAETAEKLGAVLLTGGLNPYAGDADIQWVPKGYEDILLRHFESLGCQGKSGAAVMARTTSLQVTLDYLSEKDLSSMLVASTRITPVAVAIFGNSPVEQMELSEAKCARMLKWLTADPNRSGAIPPVFHGELSAELLVDWLCELKMVYRESGGKFLRVNASFHELLNNGFAEGDGPTMKDWRMHLCQVFTDIRVRDTVEIRSVDTPPEHALMSVPAFFVGLLYDEDSRKDAISLLNVEQRAKHDLVLQEAIRHGLRGTYIDRPFLDTAKELLQISHQGLNRLVSAGAENESVLGDLTAIKEILDSGQSFADETIAWWNKDERSTVEYINRFRLRGREND